jgi:tetratricopeptide (TPR) repeat protein
LTFIYVKHILPLAQLVSQIHDNRQLILCTLTTCRLADISNSLLIACKEQNMILLFLTILFTQNSLNLLPSGLGFALVAQQEGTAPAANPTPTPKTPTPTAEGQKPPSPTPKKPWPMPPGPRPFRPGIDSELELAEYKKALENYRNKVTEYLLQEGIALEDIKGIGQAGGQDSASDGTLTVNPSQELETFREALESYRVGVEEFRKAGELEAGDYRTLLGEYYKGIKNYKETMKDIQQAVGGSIR